MQSEIKFGTDGWRDIIGERYTFKNVKIVSQAVADYLGRGKKVAVSFDTRFLSDAFAKTSADVLAACGIKVLLSDRFTPTPALSFAVKKRRLDLGIMITASHNPAAYNGFKIKVSSGGAAGPEVTKAIERLCADNPPTFATAKAEIKKTDFISDYITFLRNYIDFKRIKNKKFRVLVDAMHGSGNSYIKEVLKGTNIKLEFLRININPSFGGLRPEPIVENLGETIRKMQSKDFDLCLVLDGDADRIAAIGQGGIFIHPQKILGLLALHLIKERGFSGGLVKTIAGTTMLEHIAKSLNMPVYETPVGFKYISDLMVKEDIALGGEEAGGIGFKNYIPERDGTLAGLLLLEMMSYQNKPILHILNKVEKTFGRYYYLREDIKVKHLIKLDISGLKKLSKILDRPIAKIKDFDGIKFICDDESWLMLRSSGTEPLVRVYAESKSLSKSKKLIAFGKHLISRYVL